MQEKLWKQMKKLYYLILKQFTTAEILKLKEIKLLRTSDVLSKYFPKKTNI